MARPLKINADYFSHDNGMRSNRKILALRAKFGHEGYSIWNMFLETLTESDHFKIKLDEQEMILLSGDYQIEPEMLEEILNFCVKIRLLIKEDDVFSSPNHKERLNSVLKYRERKRVKDGNNPIKDGNNPVIPVMEEKEKEKEKVKKSKVLIDTNKTFFSLKEQREKIITKIVSKGNKESIVRAEIDKFCNYWTESGKSGKQRWEMQKTFEVEKRLRTWFSNYPKFNS